MFLSLHRLLVYLDARKQVVKLHIYRQLTVVLTASLILGVMYAAYQIYFTINQQQMIKWCTHTHTVQHTRRAQTITSHPHH